jgi:threonine dehydrogenase-like Zn-dependent dehydrogenase
VKALVFGVDAEPWTPPPVAGENRLLANLTVTPMRLMDVPDPRPLRPDWLVTRPLLAGICGSDSKMALLDFGDEDSDNAMAGLCSFPQVMGHEVVAEVVELGPEASGFEIGQRVVLNPWLSCAARGVEPLCESCQAGDLSLCYSFMTGPIAPGLHTGLSKDATGAYAELMPAHSSMLFQVPDGMADEDAVLADPFSVSLHAVTRHPPPAGGKVLVYGVGALGTTTLAALAALHPDVEVAAVARFDAQAEMAKTFGAAVIKRPDDRLQVIEELARWSGGRLVTGTTGLPMCHPGGIDVVYDTVGKPETLEVGVRLLKARGSLVKLGFHGPGRWEWSPLYFKELSWVGSNAFGMEDVDGTRQHAFHHYFDLVSDGRIQLRPMLTHTFRLDAWREAFTAIAAQGESGAVKVAFDHRSGV